MNFTLDADQRALVDAVDDLLRRAAGPARARALGADRPGYDTGLERRLAAAGFLDTAGDRDAGPLTACLVTEACARAAAVAAVGARALVAPGVDCQSLPGPVALTVAGHGGPVRFAADAATLLVAGDGQAWAVPLAPGRVPAVPSRFGYPFGRVPAALRGGRPEGGTPLGPGSAARLVSWWRVALAAELTGTMRSALDLVLSHVQTRRQFGRPIGSFQALQHRLAEAELLVQSAHWLVCEAAWGGAAEENAATALTQAKVASACVFQEAHQLTGAMGLTSEYDLHLWSMRLPALQVEADWMGSPATAVTRSRWRTG